MAIDCVRTGAAAFVQWKPESTFKTPVATKIPFGYEAKVSSFSITNNRIPLTALNSRTIQTFAYGQTKGSVGIDWVLSNPFFFRMIFGAPSIGTTLPYTYTYTVAGVNCPESFTMDIGVDQQTTDTNRQLAGCLLNSVSIRSSIGDVVRCSADIMYAAEHATSTLATPVSEDIAKAIPFTFAHGSLEYDSGSGLAILAEVQDIDLTINQNADFLYAQGSSIAASSFKKLLEITGSFTLTFKDINLLKEIFAQQKATNSFASGVTTRIEGIQLRLVFDNGETGSSNRDVRITLDGISIGDIGVSIEPNEPIMQNVSFQARKFHSLTCDSGWSAEPE